MYDIPTAVNINGISYDIRNRGDFRVILDCFDALADESLTAKERLIACLIIFYVDINTASDIEKFSDVEEAVKQMFLFFNCGQEESPGNQSKYHLVDWRTDSQLICSAINKVAGKEIRAEGYLHWWTFMGYYIAIGESTLSTVVSIRNKILKGKKLEKYESEFRRNNPQYFAWNAKSIQAKEEDRLVRELWNSN